jgi:CrcB protein
VVLFVTTLKGLNPFRQNRDATPLGLGMFFLTVDPMLLVPRTPGPNDGIPLRFSVGIYESQLDRRRARGVTRHQSVMQTFTTYLWVALGGALGSVARYALNGVVSTRLGETFPFGTLIVNATGSLIIGVLAAATLPEGRLSSDTRLFVTQFLMIGVCGGFTTFSSFSLQTINLLREREWLYAGGNVLSSVLLCLIVTGLGFMLGSRLIR